MKILISILATVVPTAITFWYRIENGKNFKNKNNIKKNSRYLIKYWQSLLPKGKKLLGLGLLVILLEVALSFSIFLDSNSKILDQNPILTAPQTGFRWSTNDSINYQLYYNILNQGKGTAYDFNKTSFFAYALRKSEKNDNNFIFENCLLKEHNSGIILPSSKRIYLAFDKISKGLYEKILFGIIITKYSYSDSSGKQIENKYLFTVYKPNSDSEGNSFFTAKDNQKEEALNFLKINKLIE